MDDREQWLKSLKVGDQFVLSQSYGYRGVVHMISRETATRFYYRINPNCEDWFHKKDGHTARGGDRFARYQTASPLTPAFLAESIRLGLVKKISDIITQNTWKAYPAEKLKTILAALEPA